MRSLVWKRIGGAAAPTGVFFPFSLTKYCSAYDYGARAVPYDYADSRGGYQQTPGYASSGYQGYQASTTSQAAASSDPYGRPVAAPAYGDSSYGNSYAGYDAYYGQTASAGTWRDPYEPNKDDHSWPGTYYYSFFSVTARSSRFLQPKPFLCSKLL